METNKEWLNNIFKGIKIKYVKTCFYRGENKGIIFLSFYSTAIIKEKFKNKNTKRGISIVYALENKDNELRVDYIRGLKYLEFQPIIRLSVIYKNKRFSLKRKKWK